MTDVFAIECDDDKEGDSDKGPCEKQVIEPQNLTTEPEDETYRCVATETPQVLFEGDKKLATFIGYYK